MTEDELLRIAEAIAAAMDMAAGDGEENNEHDAIRDVAIKIAEYLNLSERDAAGFLDDAIGAYTEREAKRILARIEAKLPKLEGDVGRLMKRNGL